MKNALTNCLIACAITAAAALPIELSAAERPKGIVTIMADDGFASQKILIEEAMKRKFGCTLAINTLGIGEKFEDPQWQTFSWEQLGAAAKVCEIAAHSEHHCSLIPSSDPEQKLCDDVYNELVWPKEDLQDRLGIEIKGFVAPYGNYNAETVKQIRDAGYVYNAGIWVDNGLTPGLNKIGGTDPFNISRFDIGGMAVVDVCRIGKEAAVKGQWGVILFHRVAEVVPEGPAGQYITSTSDFKKISACMTKLRDEGKIEILSLIDALKIAQMKPQS